MTVVQLQMVFKALMLALVCVAVLYQLLQHGHQLDEWLDATLTGLAFVLALAAFVVAVGILREGLRLHVFDELLEPHVFRIEIIEHGRQGD